VKGVIADNLNHVMERIRGAARKAGRDPGDITLICVTKKVEVKKIKEAISGGARAFGENYVQEAAEKIKKIKDGTVRWHFIGHLQKNKVKQAVELFDVIHTVDSLPLAALINKKAEKPMDVLIQVNIGGETTKGGAPPSEVVELARAISKLENLRLRGLMAIPPPTADPEAARPYFITIRRLAERVNRERIPGVTMKDLSIGMSADFHVAIEEGATMVRVGTAVFGPREEPAAGKKTARKPAGKTGKKTEKKTAPRTKKK